MKNAPQPSPFFEPMIPAVMPQRIQITTIASIESVQLQLWVVDPFDYRRREEAPNDLKLSDTERRRDACAEGSAGAGGVTERSVRWSAWLGDVPCAVAFIGGALQLDQLRSFFLTKYHWLCLQLAILRLEFGYLRLKFSYLFLELYCERQFLLLKFKITLLKAENLTLRCYRKVAHYVWYRWLYCRVLMGFDIDL